MKPFLKKVIANANGGLREKLSEEQFLSRQVNALFGLLSNIFGPDKLVLKAGKLDALSGMRSKVLAEQVLALQKIVYEDPTLDALPSPEEIGKILADIEDEIADLIARRTVEDKIEKRIAEKMQERHEEYIKEIKLQIVKEDGGPENAQTLKRFAMLEKLDRKKLARSAIEVLRPRNFKEVVGQERAITALLTKLASPYPQHILLYGPPGIGKTTVARLALEESKKLKYSPFAKDAPFVEVDGTTLRWDPREVTNPLLGSVHDPIYQGARRDLAEGGVPEPKTGLVTEAHGGILFIDEIGEMDPILQNKLLKVLEDKRVRYESSYYDPSDPHVPKYIKKLFEEGAPADFILIGATTRDPEEISPALRSRCAEVYFDPLTPADIREIVKNAARKLKVRLGQGVADLIAEYTIEGRKAIGIVADAYGLALYRQGQHNGPKTLTITREDIKEVIQTSRLTPNVYKKGSESLEVGRTFGLGVYGFVGSVLEIEAVAFPASEKGKGTLRFNEAAGSMARDSVFNAASVIRTLLNLDLADYDLHVNVIGGGKVDGPSAGLAILLAIISALQRRPARQDVAVTGEVSIQGRVKAVGGLFEKIYGAKQAGMNVVIIPKENEKDIPAEVTGIKVVPVSTVEEAIQYILPMEVIPQVEAS